MSHKAYPNLAHLETFSRDLNYTGVPLDGWIHPMTFVPIVLSVIAFITVGRPRGFLSYWALLNFALIHPMDLFVGTLGYGPRYMVDEYSVLDTRYWVVQDVCVTIVSFLEFIVMAPLCFFWYRGIVQGRPDKAFFAIQASTWQLIGTIFYVVGEIMDDFKHLPGNDFVWPPKFDSYLKLKYFWFIFVCLNHIWVFLPLTVIYKSYREIIQGMTMKHKKK
ncbi:PREDICTED: 3-beta-hydroxysteroid-Delta(8),Delta(7)-isomerase-like [Amphimedon queenslandica]|uniref:EXPERA domain-containing protein n=1 Tax=Amphimedon queenslandica TaxID=400682 RepID=A0A1X7V3U1_AMPQE|nr:PREDICTED: 3-beta-hydroxysteroid-Delta(8),Delta(7)-isomerase-like [Amphimedon queenslandica]|eukprot:XP_003385787.1 PREDICTED: 3-beta-hydroxysteroid-Delta(8),Delta(7)-isomerase-like [Amphimedon queenslandica]